MLAGMEAYYSSLLFQAEALIWICGHVMDGCRIECAMNIFFITTPISSFVHLDVAKSSHCE